MRTRLLHAIRNAVRISVAALGVLVLGNSMAQGATEASLYKKLPGKCRVGSSFGAGGPGFLPQATDRNVSVLNSASFTSQGGNGNTTGGNSSTGCGLPANAMAVVISTSVVPRGQAGTLKVFEAGKALADGNSVAFNTTDATTNDMIVPLRSPDIGADITLNSSRPVDYVLDVVGYFVPGPLAGSSSGLLSTSVGSSQTVVVSHTINVTGPGFLVTNAAATVVMFSPAVVGDQAVCGLTLGFFIEPDFSHFVSAQTTSTSVSSISATRHFGVATAGNRTVNFVCGRGNGTPNLDIFRPQLSVLFVPL
jgi:hypothetical protein